MRRSLNLLTLAVVVAAIAAGITLAVAGGGGGGGHSDAELAAAFERGHREGLSEARIESYADGYDAALKLAAPDCLRPKDAPSAPCLDADGVNALLAEWYGMGYSDAVADVQAEIERQEQERGGLDFGALIEFLLLLL